MSSISKFVEQFPVPPKKGPRMRVKQRKAKAMSPVDVAIDDAKRRASSGDWEGSNGGTFVGLYAMCHRMVYGVVPSELTEASSFHLARKMAAKVMHELFADRPAEVAAFVRWAREAEKRKNAWAQSKAIDRNHLSYRTQFSRSLETDYRIAQKQRRR